ncbi:MAG: glutamine synthetase [Deltaproteobacteria bacterium SG8_13]|nr:MAG: glutamine synthetase [Deltaproteobacteria bacterium SG8_13]
MTGMLTLEDLSRMVQDELIDTVQVVFPDLYGRLLGKRLDADFFLAHAAGEGTHACNYLLTVDMEMQPVPGYDFANWEKGYGDFHLVPDLSTLRVTSWLQRTALVMCDLSDSKDHSLIGQAPRSILKTQIEAAASLGLRVMAGTELEYYIFRDTYRDASKKNYSGLESAGWYLEDYHMLQGTREEDLNCAVRHHLKHSGIPVECSKGEWGCGQHEINLRYCDALAMADRHVLYKQCMKEVADQLGYSVTFMAKVGADQAGSSAHIHLSLENAKGNAFQGKEKFGPVRCSPVFRWFLGGWMAHAPECMVFYAPTVNSYKRFQPGSWAPTRIAWSYDNRTAGFRVVGKGQGVHIECRIPGADCNPYLAIAASIASGLDGIARRIEPPAALEGDLYVAENLPRVPSSLQEARRLFESSGFVKAALGENITRHYARFYQVEQEAFERAVTDWERQRYFERI